ncbi:MAG: replication restart helicase PriA, partial [Bdellovibrionales bacterium]
PPEDGQDVERGQSVLVPLGKRQAHGVVVKKAATEGESKFKLKPILGPDELRPRIPAKYMDWLEWLAGYYLHPLGQVVETVFPPLKKGTARASKRAPVIKEQLERIEAPKLTEEQNSVLASISAKPDFHVHLLFGVTGSGKTEVYLHLLENVLAAGKQGLVLVPEIALTPQLIDRFSKRFPGMIAVLHSHLTPREKTNQWWSIVNKEKKILIGARSALFCPLEDLGLIILDEEHEPSYKQDETLKYHARDAAIVLANKLNIPIVLGSATPSLESWNNVLTGKFQLHTMAQRVNARALPSIEVVDLRTQNSLRKDTPSKLPFWLSDRLYEELQHVFAKNEQAALFLNRRGVAQTAQCRACGFATECPNCSVSLTLHGRSHLVCHYCDYTERMAELCPNCKEGPLEALGLGTEKIEEDMATLFPELRIARADRDEVQSRDQLEALITSVERHEIDLLIGTQMIAKGLDFPKLNLVGLVLADVGFHWPDFRASERSFQLLTQVSGRSGRQSAGRVVIQTYNPEHSSIVYTVNADFKGFSEMELQERAELHYPPAWRMAMFRIQGADADATKATAKFLVQRAQALQKQNETYAKDLLVLGPAQAPLFKLRNKFRYQVMIKCDSAQRLNHFCRQILANDDWIPSGTKVQVDIDPFQML